MRYYCDYPNCTKSYSKSCHLMRHISSAHSGKKYKCDVEGCGAVFNRSDHLKRHSENLHQRIRHICSIDGCGASYSKKWDLKKHQLNVHNFAKPLPKRKRGFTTKRCKQEYEEEESAEDDSDALSDSSSFFITQRRATRKRPRASEEEEDAVEMLLTLALFSEGDVDILNDCFDIETRSKRQKKCPDETSEEKKFTTIVERKFTLPLRPKRSPAGEQKLVGGKVKVKEEPEYNLESTTTTTYDFYHDTEDDDNDLFDDDYDEPLFDDDELVHVSVSTTVKIENFDEDYPVSFPSQTKTTTTTRTMRFFPVKGFNDID